MALAPLLSKLRKCSSTTPLSPRLPPPPPPPHTHTHRSLGCHRVVNYRRERLREVLKAEYPRGLDLVYESGGLGWQQAAAVPPPSALPPARDQLDAAVPRADAPRPGRPAHLPTRPLCSGRGDV
jgi:hypothetical protein